MKREVLILILCTFVITTGCTDKKLESELEHNMSEVKRLAAENIDLRKELNEIKPDYDYLESQVEILEENLEYARLSQEELIKKLAAENLDRVKTYMNKSLSDVISQGYIEFWGASSVEYGNIIYGHIDQNGMEYFLNELSQYGLSHIDNVTKSLVDYIDESNRIDEFLIALDSHVLDDTEEYILIRMRQLLKAKSN